MVRIAFRFVVAACVVTCAISMGVDFARAQPPQGNGGGPQMGPQGGPQNGRPQTYQRQGFDRSRGGRDRRRDNFQQYPYSTPQVNSGWYQRPYPTHLDYFRLRSNEAPPQYFGNWNGGYYGPWAGPVGVSESDGGEYLNPPNENNANNNQGVSPRDLWMQRPSGQKQGGDTGGNEVKEKSESLPAPSK